MRTLAGLTLLALLALAPAAGASTVSVQGSVVTYVGDAGADTVELTRVQSQGNTYYLVYDDQNMSAGQGCTKSGNWDFVACEVQSTPRRYSLRTGSGDDAVAITGDTAGGTADLGPGNDRFNGRTTGAAGEAVHGADGNDIVMGGSGRDAVFGDGGADQVAGDAGNDKVDGGPGDDQLEAGGEAMAATAGSGADDIRGGTGVDRLSYLENDTRVSVSLDGQAGDGSAGEGDNAHGDVEIVVGSTFDDVLTGNDAGQQLFGNAGADRAEGLGGDDLLNGGTGNDELYGGTGRDRLEGSADEDYLEGGAGDDVYEGDNVCTTLPCTGGSDFIQARDGEADTVNCGVGADTALVDDVDVVAQDIQHGCERVDRAANAAPAGQGGPGATQAGVPKVRVVGTRKLRTLRRGKFRIEVTCPGSCRVEARLIAGRTVVATRTRTRLAGGKVVLRPKTSRKGRRTLQRRKRVRLTLAVDVTDDQGTVTTLARVLTFRR